MVLFNIIDPVPQKHTLSIENGVSFLTSKLFNKDMYTYYDNCTTQLSIFYLNLTLFESILRIHIIYNNYWNKFLLLHKNFIKNSKFAFFAEHIQSVFVCNVKISLIQNISITKKVLHKCCDT